MAHIELRGVSKSYGDAVALRDLTGRLVLAPAALAAGVVVDGMSVRIASGSAAAGDRFLLQPVAAAATGMVRLLDDLRGLRPEKLVRRRREKFLRMGQFIG